MSVTICLVESLKGHCAKCVGAEPHSALSRPKPYMDDESTMPPVSGSVQPFRCAARTTWWVENGRLMDFRLLDIFTRRFDGKV